MLGVVAVRCGAAPAAVSGLARHQVVQRVGAGVVIVIREATVGSVRGAEVSVGVGGEVFKISSVGGLDSAAEGGVSVGSQVILCRRGGGLVSVGVH